MRKFKLWASKIKYIGPLLLLVATLLSLAFSGIGLIWGFFESIIRAEFSQYCERLAEAEDRLGNVSCQYMFNHLLIQKDGYKFGNPKETISSVEGKNKELKKLSDIGYWIASDLDEIQTNHVENAIDNNV